MLFGQKCTKLWTLQLCSRVEHPIVQLSEVDAISDGESPWTPCWGKAEEVSPWIFYTPALFPHILAVGPCAWCGHR